MITTLNKIRAHRPCLSGWETLLRHLGKTQADDEPIPLETVLDSNGLPDALWCLRAVDGHDREIRLYAVWCARQVQHLMPDPRSLAALDVAERFARKEASAEELVATRGAAWEAAWESAAAAWEAAWERAAAAWAAQSAAEREAAERKAEAEARAITAVNAKAAAEARADAMAAIKAAQEAQIAEFRRMCREGYR